MLDLLLDSFLVKVGGIFHSLNNDEQRIFEKIKTKKIYKKDLSEFDKNIVDGLVLKGILLRKKDVDNKIFYITNVSKTSMLKRGKDNIYLPTSKVIKKWVKENKPKYKEKYEDEYEYHLFKDAWKVFNSTPLLETISHLRKDYPKISEEQFNKILKLDPTYAGGDKETPYTRWIFKLIYNNIKNMENLQRYNELMEKYPNGINLETNQLINKPIMLPEVLPEDVYKIPDLIAGYEENKKLIKLPITSFTSLPALSKAVSDAKERDISLGEKAGTNFRAFKEAIPDGLNVVYQDNNWIIGIPTTYKASEHFKEITSWCTGKPNMYVQYTEKLGGNPLYIHLNKKTGDLYQMDFGTSSFMDINDASIDVPSFLKENPQLKKFYESIILNNDKFFNMPQNWKFIDKKYITEEMQLAVVKQNGVAIFYIIEGGITPSEQVQVAAVTQNGYAIEDIIDGGITPSEKVQLAAVTQNGYAIRFIDNPSEQIQLAAVKQNGDAIDNIIKLGITPSEQVLLETVKQNGYLIQYIIKLGITPTEQIQLAAVKQNGWAIRFIDKPSEQIQLAAVKQNGDAIDNIIKLGITPSEKVQLEAVKQNGDAIDNIIKLGITPSEQVLLEAVKQNGYLIQYIIKLGITPTEQIQLAAVKQNGWAIQYIIKLGITPSEKVQLAAVKQNGDAIDDIIKGGIIPSEQVQLEAVKQNGLVIEYIIKAGITPSEQVQVAAVKQDGYSIRYIIYAEIIPSEQVQLIAVKQNPASFDYIKKPYPSVVKLHKELSKKPRL